MDFERARFNMVEQQIRPWDVLEQDVLDLLLATHRENFVAPEYRTLALSDLEVPISVDGHLTGETMLAPKVEGRILQAVAAKRHESVLVVGAGSGYLTGLLAHRARKVTALEIQSDIGKFAAKNLKSAGLHNAEVQIADASSWFSGGADVERFDAIVFCGGLALIPPGLSARLTPGGRAFVFEGKFPIVQAKLLTMSPLKNLAGPVLFETSAKPLRNFQNASAFKF
jgi:protein-L-isoaspartate(D-aspartate) O-methyltransferase